MQYFLQQVRFTQVRFSQADVSLVSLARQNVLRFLQYVLLSVFLVSCSSLDRPDREELVLDETGDYKYSAWRLNLAEDYKVINPLLKQADSLIEKGQYNAAIDKLERALRIKPGYAQAWSRLSWLALQTDSPKRSVQMAKRSNSVAFSNSNLQILNWTFISTASKALNDDGAYKRANQEIESLRAF